jgi:hypothetical protein
MASSDQLFRDRRFNSAATGYNPAMAFEQEFTGIRLELPRAKQLSFDELAALRASDEANADAVIGEILATRVGA